jgi:hypothetical protein
MRELREGKGEKRWWRSVGWRISVGPRQVHRRMTVSGYYEPQAQRLHYTTLHYGVAGTSTTNLEMAQLR